MHLIPQMPHRRAAKRFLGVYAVLLLLCLTLEARAEKLDQLKPQGYVSDFAGVLAAPARAQLIALCAEVDQKAAAQIAVVTVRSLEGVPVEDFAVNLATRWGVGPKQKDRGVLILLAIADRKYRVEVGYGLEPILPDGKVGGFAREIVPLLRQSDYGGALLQLTSRIAEVIAADRGVALSIRATPVRRDRRRPNELPFSGLLLFLLPALFGAFILFLVFGALLNLAGVGGRRRRSGYGGWWLGGLGGGLGGGGWGGGGFGGGGGSFGGFGGGSFGGGGASGSW